MKGTKKPLTLSQFRKIPAQDFLLLDSNFITHLAADLFIKKRRKKRLQSGSFHNWETGRIFRTGKKMPETNSNTTTLQLKYSTRLQ